ncbi:Dynamin central region [Musa troglodytarum]|uniref:Dynamin central region n=1 Tax=Musa troglodytarum TaxID=320322 RepID=A0A9E7H742_9LILI|nr:Dynamin central region [Musa troglodytarum]
MAALASSYNQRIRPLLDAVDRLRHLNVMQEGIELPTIVVVGDQSSGKSSVLESIAGISLPRGQGICTRVPLIMRLQNDPSAQEPHLQLEYQGKVVTTSESAVPHAINAATDEIAGTSKGISDVPITLIVKKKGVPDLTMVDLPGITRVPVHGQPENIYEQISQIIMKYITPKESIILNVIFATVDFPTCESIRMSQCVDKSGERTLAVVTKADKAPEGLLEKVTSDDVNIGLGYVCVRNRVGNETYEEAREKEMKLFKEHPLLSCMDKSIVGVQMLAQKLTQIQTASIAKCLPDIAKKINDKFNRNIAELEQMPQHLSTIADALRAFMRILSAAKESMRKLLIRGDFEEFSDDVGMHATACVAGMHTRYANQLPSQCPTTDDKFLMEEIDVLEEVMGIGLPNFLPRIAFHTILKRKIKMVTNDPHQFVLEVWGYVEDVVVRVLLLQYQNFPQLQSSIRAATQDVVDKMRRKSLAFVKEIIEMEMNAYYTWNTDYIKTWTELMDGQRAFKMVIDDHSRRTVLELSGFGTVDVCHLRPYGGMAVQAFDLRTRLMAYWKSVLLRLVDGMALHILYSIKCLVENEIEVEIMNNLVGEDMIGLQRMMEESTVIAAKRERLRKSITLLKESKDVLAQINDHIYSV